MKRKCNYYILSMYKLRIIVLIKLIYMTSYDLIFLNISDKYSFKISQMIFKFKYHYLSDSQVSTNI